MNKGAPARLRPGPRRSSLVGRCIHRPSGWWRTKPTGSLTAEQIARRWDPGAVRQADAWTASASVQRVDRPCVRQRVKQLGTSAGSSAGRSKGRTVVRSVGSTLVGLTSSSAARPVGWQADRWAVSSLISNISRQTARPFVRGIGRNTGRRSGRKMSRPAVRRVGSLLSRQRAE